MCAIPIAGRDVSAHRAHSDGAIAAEHERDLPLGDRLLHAPRGLLDDVDDGIHVLGPWIRVGGDRLELGGGQVVDAQPTLLGGRDHDALARVGRVHPDRGVVARRIAALVVVIDSW